MKNSERGFVSTIFSIIGALIILQFVFKVDVIGFLKSPDVGEVFSYLKRFVVLIWEKFLVAPASFLWHEVFINIVWNTIKDGFEILKGWVDTQD
jgi:hypothetical protein